MSQCSIWVALPAVLCSAIAARGNGPAPVQQGVAAPAVPKVERVKPLDPDPLKAAPSVFFFQDLDSIGDLKPTFHDTSQPEGRLGITAADPFSGKRSLQQTYIPKEQMQGDPGGAGWCWRFFGANPNSSRIEDRTQHRVVVARWYHKFEEGFAPRDGAHWPPKMARMRCFGPGDWVGLYTVLFWFEDADGHLSIERNTKAPGAHREWPPNCSAQFRLADPQNIGRWIHFEMRVALGDGPRSDQIQAWADGVLVCDVTGDDLAAGYRAQALNGMSWDCYWNGGSPRKQSRFYDDLVLSSEPVGPVRTSANPTIVKSPFAGSGPEDRQRDWEAEVAHGVQAPLVVEHTVDGVATQYKPADIAYTTVWRGSRVGEGNQMRVDGKSGRFFGPLAGKDRLAPNTLYFVRVRQRGGGGKWSPWSTWHSGFATAWGAATKPDDLAPPIGYRLGHAAVR